MLIIKKKLEVGILASAERPFRCKEKTRLKVNDKV